ncbi:GL18416 [Drosophila persimilis]|uniref:Upstream activation factor subunit spp27 n=2 Tax=pseudoobscura subgroup TaxID=32358 RepID=Q29F77_DROPS|nr:upstream activation factor subunit spp27 [Drosophila pseudoobscura]XP_017138486.1 upstream activation factor subunit spp27 [Drosophila miranda]XP_026849466.1 upstream activation factor subunit spp27 [Drosophila persimilis]EDW36754.1 GL18416 [Drosophila persimilis]
MSDISSEDLRREVQAVLKDADLATISAKRVREQVEGKLNCSLLGRKKEFDKIVMEVINEQQDEEEDDDDDKDPDADPDDESEPSEEESPSSSEEEKAKKKPVQKKRPQPTKHKAPKKKRKTLNADDSGTESDAGSDSDYEVVKKPPAKKKTKAAGGGSSGTGAPRKSTGFTRAYNLSPELSALMGAPSLPRHEVVKKVWAIIKERDLYDPKNKQFAICDEELMKVMKIRRFRTFGMLKHLKPHFLD